MQIIYEMRQGSFTSIVLVKIQISKEIVVMQNLCGNVQQA